MDRLGLTVRASLVQAVTGLWRRAGTVLGHAGCMPLDGIFVLLLLGSLALSILGSVRALR